MGDELSVRERSSVGGGSTVEAGVKEPKYGRIECLRNE